MNVPLNARTALLLALTHPGHGLELINRIERRTGGRVRLQQGSVYRALTQLEQLGLVRSWQVPSGVAGRPRRYHELTIEGVLAASAEREALLSLTAAPRAGELRPAEARLMRDRIRGCADVSAFVLDLQRRMRVART